MGRVNRQNEMFMEGLGHEEALVRNACLDYQSDLPGNGPAVTRKALEAIDRYGRAAFQYPHQLKTFPIDARTASWVRRHVDSYDWETEWNAVYHYLSWLTRGPDLPGLVDWLKKDCAGRPRRETPRLRLSGLLRAARTRHAIEQMDLEAAFKRLHACFEKLEDADSYRQELWEEVEWLCQRMLALEGPAALRPLVEEWLDFDADGACLPNDLPTYMGVYLAGYCGMTDYLPQILSLFALDEEGLNEYIQQALTEMGTPAVLREIRLTFPGLSWVGQLYTSSVYERHPYPEFIGFFQDQLADPDPDEPVQLSFAMALAVCGTTESLAAAQAFYDTAPEHPEMEHIGQMLYTQYRLRGIDHPELSSMRDRLLEFERRIALVNEKLSTGHLDGEKPIPFPGNAGYPGAVEPGRNDPCPCGSGKKYKKCCLKK